MSRRSPAYHYSSKKPLSNSWKPQPSWPDSRLSSNQIRACFQLLPASSLKGKGLNMIEQPTIRGNGNLHQTATLARRAKKGRLNIIGVSSGYHDSACSLLQDGVLVAAVQEERFSRIKNDKSFPTRAFAYCLQEGGITIADVDCVAYYEDPCLKLGRQIWMSFMSNLPVERRESILDR